MEKDEIGPKDHSAYSSKNVDDPIKDREIKRILFVEKMIMMPVKTAFLIFSFLFFFTPDQDFRILSKHFFFYQSILYVIANLFFLIILTWAQLRQWALGTVKAAAFFLAIIDNLYISFLIPLTGGLESPIYWIYSGLLIRNAANFPDIRQQGIINLAFCVFYGTAVYVSERESGLFLEEVFYLKIIVLILVSICCYGLNVLLQRKVVQFEDARELQLRREKIHAVQRLAGEIAHGLKNPLSIINNSAYQLEKHLPSAQTELFNQVGIIRDEVHRADKILSQIMNYSKLSNVFLVKLNINDVLERTLKEMHFETAFPDVSIIKKSEKKLPSVFFDEGHLKQIFSNLILNGAEAVLENSRKDGTVTISTSIVGRQNLIISFSDNGIGMTQEQINKIFNAFFTTKEKGTGLGLSIVKNIIETYDGTVEVSSSQGEGTTFTVKLPIWAAP
jgi:signal transduction histidine kinase